MTRPTATSSREAKIGLTYGAATNTTATSPREAKVGLAYGVAAYFVWGLLPIYFKWVLARGPNALVLVSHRIIWAQLFLIVIIAIHRQWDGLGKCFKSKKAMLALAGSTVMIAGNWYVFVYSVQTHQLLQAGVGYYINPLVNVLLGFIFLRERFRRLQIVGLFLAFVGVAILTYNLGTLPWIPFALAGTFGFYGLLRKTMPAGPLIGLTIETLLLLPIAAAIAGVQFKADVEVSHVDLVTYGLFMAAGVITAMPLLWFAAAARRLRLSTMGFLQYVGPTLQTLVAVWYLGEPFKKIQWLTFGLIWTALILYSVDSVRALNQARTQAIEQEERLKTASEID